ncbi:TPA: hypothetical protein ACSQRE_001177 [Clostridium perfringens]
MKNQYELKDEKIGRLLAVYFQSIGNVKKSIFLSLLRQVILFIPIVFIILRVYGLNGVWISQPLADIGAAILIVLFVIKEFYIRDTHDLICRAERT